MGKFTVERSRTIDAPAARIWPELLDINSWPDWKPFIKASSWTGDALEVGSEFKMNICVKGRLSAPVKVKVVQKDEPGYVAWTGGIPHAAVSVHSFKLEEKDGKTIVTSREDFTGALVFMMLWFVKEEDLVSLHDRWLDAIARRVAAKK
ncbi:MAG TPA: SRPBCC domain-containing protein [bacterium]|nr:SRPBCC domain-containing protein [bacterium]